MEKRLNKKIESYISAFKDSIREKATQLGLTKFDNTQVLQLLQYIYDYERLTLQKEDFAKRKRVKNVVPFFDRCCAKRAAGEQCTRKKKDGSEYCGTHMKGTPHGIVDLQEDVKTNVQKLEVWVQEIKGIVYHIDKYGNVYSSEDIVLNKLDPKIIGKYEKNGEKYVLKDLQV